MIKVRELSVKHTPTSGDFIMNRARVLLLLLLGPRLARISNSDNDFDMFYQQAQRQVISFMYTEVLISHRTDRTNAARTVKTPQGKQYVLSLLLWAH